MSKSRSQGKTANTNTNTKPIAKNKRAWFEFEILQKVEAGIELKGTEVKSLRAGKVSIDESFGRIEDGEVFLHGLHIAIYEPATVMNHEPTRVRKLLLHRREIKKLAGKVEQRGFTLLPLSIYFRHGLVKVQLGLARGKSLVDRRESIKRRDEERQVQREMAGRHFSSRD